MKISEHANYLLNEYGRLQFDYAAYCKPDGEPLRNEARNNLETYIAELEAENIRLGIEYQRMRLALGNIAINSKRALKESPTDHLTAQWRQERQDDKSSNDTQTETFVYGKDSKPLPCPFCGEIVKECNDVATAAGGAGMKFTEIQRKLHQLLNEYEAAVIAENRGRNRSCYNEIENKYYQKRMELKEFVDELEAEVTKCHELQDSYCDRIAELEATVEIHADISNAYEKRISEIVSLSNKANAKLQARIAELETKIRHNALWQASEDAEERAHLEKLVPDLKKRIAELERDFDMLFRSSANK